jgi:hypothetical protein
MNAETLHLDRDLHERLNCRTVTAPSSIAMRSFRMLEARLAGLSALQMAIVSVVFICTISGAIAATMMFRWWNGRCLSSSRTLTIPR